MVPPYEIKGTLTRRAMFQDFLPVEPCGRVLQSTRVVEQQPSRAERERDADVDGLAEAVLLASALGCDGQAHAGARPPTPPLPPPLALG